MPKSSWSWGFICSCYMWVWSSMVKLIGWYTYTNRKGSYCTNFGMRDAVQARVSKMSKKKPLQFNKVWRDCPKAGPFRITTPDALKWITSLFCLSWFGFLWTDSSELWCSLSTAFIPRTFSDQDVSWISAILIHLSNPMLHNWDIKPI